MSAPLVSCIVPVFNGARYLREALDTIVAQTYRPLEVIVADDGSTDASAEIADAYGEPVRCVRQPNGGVAAARNLGLAHAQGDFITCLDADDLWHPEKLTRQMQRFAARPDLDISGTHLQNFWVPELRAEAERLRDHRLAQPFTGFMFQTLVVRRSVYDTVGRFDEGRQHSSEEEWLLRVRQVDVTIEVLPEVLTSRRLHGDNASRRGAAKSVDEFLRLVKGHLDQSRRRAAAPSTRGTARRDS